MKALAGAVCSRRPHGEAGEHLLTRERRHSQGRIQLTSSLNFFALLVSSRKANMASRPA